ncbi:MAG TPA: HAD-IA family hydrolase [Gemmatimonadales bacterium]|nr:HAD-IA family hydrolase [Gemmatimonadales bacterium]
MARPRAVLFDAGNTLIFLDYPRLAAGMGRVTGLPLTGAMLEARAAEAARAMERAAGSDRERAAAYLEALALLVGVPHEALEAVRAELYRLHAERHLWSGVHPGTAPALARLRDAGLRLGVVSNSDGRVDSALVAAGLRDHFEVVVDSALVGIEKPDPRIFAAALARLDVGPADALYVGDVYEVDVVGARAAGMPVALVDPLGHHAGRDVPTVPSVAALVDRLLAGDTPQPVP